MEGTGMEGITPVQDITGRRRSEVLVCIIYFYFQIASDAEMLSHLFLGSTLVLADWKPASG